MFTNNNNLPLSLAVFLAHDEYPEHREGVISVTTLIKPVKEIVLGMRAKKEGKSTTQDIAGRIASSYGTALHNGIERAWVSPNLKDTLTNLGYPAGMRDVIKVNPSEDELDDCIAVYTELRTEKPFKGWIISGELDFLADGRLRDFKSTGTYTYINKTNDAKYILQGSMYRWLNPEKVTDDVMAIDYIFTDWNGLSAHTQKGKYPPLRMMEQLFQLMPIDETEKYISDKLALVDKLRYADQSEIPECTNEDLWVDPSKFKYYKDPTKTGRATRVFDTHAEALVAFTKDKRVGLIMEHKGQVKACKYCAGLPTCNQAERYINSGELTL